MDWQMSEHGYNVTEIQTLGEFTPAQDAFVQRLALQASHPGPFNGVEAISAASRALGGVDVQQTDAPSTTPTIIAAGRRKTTPPQGSSGGSTPTT